MNRYAISGPRSPSYASRPINNANGSRSRDYPDVILDVTTTEEGRVNLVDAGFDAGIHLGEFIERDMVAVRVSGEQRAAIVGAPAYFASHSKPKAPRDLTGHRCINFRHGSAGVYHWEFEKGRKSLAVAVNGPLVVDDVEVMIQAAVDGTGLAFALEDHVRAQLDAGALVRVLEDWCPPFTAISCTTRAGGISPRHCPP